MSRQRTLEQKRASKAWDFVQSIKGLSNKDVKEKYSALARKAPADIQSSGFGQTIAFWNAKGNDKSESASAENMAHQKLLAHVKDWLNDSNSLHLNKTDLVEWVSKEAQMEDYRRATAEAIAFLVWVKRFAEAELA